MALFIFCMFAVLAGLALVGSMGSIEFFTAWALALGLIAASFLPMAIEWKRGQFDLFNLKNAFLGYYVLQFGVWALWILATGDTKFIRSLAAWEDSLQLALLWAFLGVIAFHLGYYTNLGRSLARLLPSFSLRWSPFRTNLFVVAFLFLGVFSFFYIVAAWGGLGDFLEELGAARTEGIRGKGYPLLMAWYFPTVALLLCYARAVESKAKIYFLLSFGILLVGAGIGLSLGYRAFVVFPILQLFCLHHYLRRRIGFHPKYLLLLLPLAMLLNVYTFYRDTPLEQIDFDEVVSHLQTVQFWKDSGTAFLGRFSGIETLTLVIDRFDTPAYGIQSLTYLLTFPIPRAVWPEKVTPVSQFYETVFPDVSNPEGSNTTLPGELYWNFHVAGILLGMFLVGVFCKTTYSYLQLHFNQSTLLFYAAALVYVIWFIEAPTTLTALFMAMISILLPTLMVLTASQPPASQSTAS